ncbi:MAG: 50S ribosomal protein L15 [Candidatus Cloacimonetes bacterium]|nr:50S ribosomal protein L15 [Candidatus Cloacimonadota bacterium]
MNLHSLKGPGNRKNKKRLGKGHGTGWGGTAGRGHKGQKSRSGGNIPVWFEGGQMPIQRRLPKRGFKNRFRIEYRIVNLSVLEKLESIEVNITMMEEAGILKKTSKTKITPVKILAGGSEEFTKRMVVKANAFSKAAIQIIEKNGGKAEVV